jgi:hypothetical protein
VAACRYACKSSGLDASINTVRYGSMIRPGESRSYLAYPDQSRCLGSRTTPVVGPVRISRPAATTTGLAY